MIAPYTLLELFNKLLTVDCVAASTAAGEEEEEEEEEGVVFTPNAIAMAASVCSFFHSSAFFTRTLHCLISVVNTSCNPMRITYTTNSSDQEAKCAPEESRGTATLVLLSMLPEAVLLVLITY
jgi:hypothetical protein